MMSSQLPQGHFWVKKQKMSYKFKHEVDKVWNFIKDVRETYKVLKDLRTDAEFIKGERSFEKDAEFLMTWKSFVKMKFVVKEVIEEKDFKQLHYLVECDPTNVRYSYIYTLYKISTDNTTYLLWEWIYEGEKGIILSETHEKMLHKERSQMLERFEQFLSAPVANLNHKESSDFPCSGKTLWKIITNWPLFRKISPQICDSCSYEGKPEELGTILTMKFTEKKEAICMLKVTKSDFNPSEGRHFYSLLCFDGTPKIPSQELKFTIIEMQEKSSLLIFEHQYLEPIDCKLLKSISKYKKSILKDLKQALVKCKEKEKAKEKSN